MSFSEVFRIEKNVFKFSYDGKYVAYAFQNNVFIRNSRSNKIVRSFPAMDIVQYVEWSPDSKYLLCSLYQRGIVQILSLQFPNWKCKIRESEIGIKKALWCPDSRHILTVGNFNVWACIWSLSDLSVKYISNLKSVIDCVVEFSNDGKWLAAIERVENSHSVSTFSSTSWHLSKRFPCNQVEIIGGLSWSPDSNTVCVWDKRVDICRALIISLLRDAIYVFEKNVFGISNLSWSPSGQFLALGCYDGKVRLLNYITWSEFQVFTHSENIDSPICTVYKEFPIDSDVEVSKKKNCNPTYETIFKEVATRPVLIRFQKECSGVIPFTNGVCLNCFSNCGQFLVTSDYSAPATLWIWNVNSGILHTFLSFDRPVVDVAWDPCSAQLAAATLSRNVCLWAPATGASVIQTPESELWDISVSSIQWHPSGHTLGLNSRNVLVLLWFSEEAEVIQE